MVKLRFKKWEKWEVKKRTLSVYMFEKPEGLFSKPEGWSCVDRKSSFSHLDSLNNSIGFPAVSDQLFGV